MVDFDEFLRYFERVRQRTRRVAALIPADCIEWTHKPEAFTLGDLVRHIAVAERFIWAETVLNRRTLYVTHGRELADGRDGVLALLDQLHDESMAIFRSLTPDALTGVPASMVRHWPIASKFSRLSPSGVAE